MTTQIRMQRFFHGVTLPNHGSVDTPRSLAARPSKMMLERRFFPFGVDKHFFRGELLNFAWVFPEMKLQVILEASHFPLDRDRARKSLKNRIKFHSKHLKKHHSREVSGLVCCLDRMPPPFLQWCKLPRSQFFQP